MTATARKQTEKNANAGLTDSCSPDRGPAPPTFREGLLTQVTHFKSFSDLFLGLSPPVCFQSLPTEWSTLTIPAPKEAPLEFSYRAGWELLTDGRSEKVQKSSGLLSVTLCSSFQSSLMVMETTMEASGKKYWEDRTMKSSLFLCTLLLLRSECKQLHKCTAQLHN